MVRIFALLLVTFAWLPAAAAQDDLAERYHAAYEADDHDGLVELWRANPGAVLFSIDADLEQSLSLRESGEAAGEVDEQAIVALHRRALFGARAASEALGHPIFSEYAGSFVGWDRAQQRSFRAGQAAYGKARKAAAEGELQAAVDAGRECLQLAEPLGDWWGMAMGLTAMGQAQQALGLHEQALASLARARMIHHDLGLFGSELGNVQALIASCMELGRERRALESARAGVSLARQLGVEPAVEEFGTVAQALEARLDG